MLEDTYRAPRVVAIHHHFCRDDIPYEAGRLGAAGADDRPITIGFLGTLFKPPRVPGGALVDTIRRLREAGTNVELHVHGGVAPELVQEVGALQRGGVFLHGRTTHSTGVGLLGQYDYLLLLLANLPNSEAVMSIKLPHYLLAGRPILALVPERSAVAEIVRKTGTGVVIPSSSDWAEPLRRVLDDREGALLPARNEAAIEQFSWEYIADEWLDAICGQDAPR